MKTYLSHDKCYDLAVQQSEQIKAGSKEREANYNRIVTIPRGGLVLAGWLSYLLDIREIVTQYTLDYEIHILELPADADQHGETLIVDDLVDTGTTLQLYQDLDFTIATLFKKPWSAIDPDYFIEETQDWIVFPWEHEEEEAVREMKVNKDGKVA